MPTGKAIVHWIGCIKADPRAEKHIYTNFCKCNSFPITTDLLNSENLKVAITQLCNEPQAMLQLTQK